jgi:hypothetical protein
MNLGFFLLGTYRLGMFIVQGRSLVGALCVFFANFAKKNLLSRAAIGDEPIAVFDEAICAANIALHLSPGGFRYG